jgi:hypothetical protein
MNGTETGNPATQQRETFQTDKIKLSVETSSSPDVGGVKIDRIEITDQELQDATDIIEAIENKGDEFSWETIRTGSHTIEAYRGDIEIAGEKYMAVKVSRPEKRTNQTALSGRSLKGLEKQLNDLADNPPEGLALTKADPKERRTLMSGTTEGTVQFAIADENTPDIPEMLIATKVGWSKNSQEMLVLVRDPQEALEDINDDSGSVAKVKDTGKRTLRPNKYGKVLKLMEDTHVQDGLIYLENVVTPRIQVDNAKKKIAELEAQVQTNNPAAQRILALEQQVARVTHQLTEAQQQNGGGGGGENVDTLQTEIADLQRQLQEARAADPQAAEMAAKETELQNLREQLRIATETLDAEAEARRTAEAEINRLNTERPLSGRTMFEKSSMRKLQNLEKMMKERRDAGDDRYKDMTDEQILAEATILSAWADSRDLERYLNDPESAYNPRTDREKIINYITEKFRKAYESERNADDNPEKMTDEERAQLIAQYEAKLKEKDDEIAKIKLKIDQADPKDPSAQDAKARWERFRNEQRELRRKQAEQYVEYRRKMMEMHMSEESLMWDMMGNSMMMNGRVPMGYAGMMPMAMGMMATGRFNEAAMMYGVGGNQINIFNGVPQYGVVGMGMRPDMYAMSMSGMGMPMEMRPMMNQYMMMGDMQMYAAMMARERFARMQYGMMQNGGEMNQRMAVEAMLMESADVMPPEARLVMYDFLNGKISTEAFSKQLSDIIDAMPDGPDKERLMKLSIDRASETNGRVSQSMMDFQLKMQKEMKQWQDTAVKEIEGILNKELRNREPSAEVAALQKEIDELKKQLKAAQKTEVDEAVKQQGEQLTGLQAELAKLKKDRENLEEGSDEAKALDAKIKELESKVNAQSEQTSQSEQQGEDGKPAEVKEVTVNPELVQAEQSANAVLKNFELGLEADQTEVPKWKRFVKAAGEIILNVAGGAAGKALISGMVLTGITAIGIGTAGAGFAPILAAGLAGAAGGGAVNGLFQGVLHYSVFKTDKHAPWSEKSKPKNGALSFFYERSRKQMIEQYKLPDHLKNLTEISYKLASIDVSSPNAYKLEELNKFGVSAQDVMKAYQELYFLRQATNFSNLDAVQLPEGIAFKDADGNAVKTQDALNKLLAQIPAIMSENLDMMNDFEKMKEEADGWVEEAYEQGRKIALFSSVAKGVSIGFLSGSLLKIIENVQSTGDMWGHPASKTGVPKSGATGTGTGSGTPPGTPTAPTPVEGTPEYLAALTQAQGEQAQTISQIAAQTGIPESELMQFAGSDGVFNDSAEVLALADRLKGAGSTVGKFVMSGEPFEHVPKGWEGLGINGRIFLSRDGFGDPTFAGGTWGEAQGKWMTELASKLSKSDFESPAAAQAWRELVVGTVNGQSVDLAATLAKHGLTETAGGGGIGAATQSLIQQLENSGATFTGTVNTLKAALGSTGSAAGAGAATGAGSSIISSIKSGLSTVGAGAETLIEDAAGTKFAGEVATQLGKVGVWLSGIIGGGLATSAIYSGNKTSAQPAYLREGQTYKTRTPGTGSSTGGTSTGPTRTAAQGEKGSSISGDEIKQAQESLGEIRGKSQMRTPEAQKYWRDKFFSKNVPGTNVRVEDVMGQTKLGASEKANIVLFNEAFGKNKQRIYDIAEGALGDLAGLFASARPKPEGAALLPTNLANNPKGLGKEAKKNIDTLAGSVDELIAEELRLMQQEDIYPDRVQSRAKKFARRINPEGFGDVFRRLGTDWRDIATPYETIRDVTIITTALQDPTVNQKQKERLIHEYMVSLSGLIEETNYQEDVKESRFGGVAGGLAGAATAAVLLSPAGVPLAAAGTSGAAVGAFVGQFGLKSKSRALPQDQLLGIAAVRAAVRAAGYEVDVDNSGEVILTGGGSTPTDVDAEATLTTNQINMDGSSIQAKSIATIINASKAKPSQSRDTGSNSPRPPRRNSGINNILGSQTNPRPTFTPEQSFQRESAIRGLPGNALAVADRELLAQAARGETVDPAQIRAAMQGSGLNANQLRDLVRVLDSNYDFRARNAANPTNLMNAAIAALGGA